MNYILASQSPRRREILSSLGLTFEVVTSEADESSDITDPHSLVEELACRKGKAVRDFLKKQGRDLSDTVIIASDTVVTIDGKILGKPHGREDAAQMLRSYSGRTHEVVSGICLICGDRLASAHEVTEVEFDAMDEETVLRYVNTSEPYDKAGAYAIQGLASAYIKGIRGDYFNVVGLPVHCMNQLHKTLLETYMF